MCRKCAGYFLVDREQHKAYSYSQQRGYKKPRHVERKRKWLIVGNLASPQPVSSLQK
nr:MAG TPA: hypothetical protein [Caudoviricetes sp.]